jgi:hypothetical protein
VSAWGRKDSKWTATITDVSQGGIRLILRRRFEPGSGLGIELPGGDGEEPYTVLAKVIHVRSLPNGAWALGCQFISELDEDEVQRLRPRQHPAAARQPAGPAPLVPSQHRQAINDVSLQMEIPPGRVIECRIRHLSVAEGWPLVAGKTLGIRADSALPLLQLKVVRCWQEGERWTLRCQLLNPVTDELMQMLLLPVTAGAGTRAPA